MSHIANWTELGPTYGRDYTTAKAVKDAFLDCHDFRYFTTGQVTAFDDEVWDSSLSITILLRYAKLTKVVPLKITMKALSERNDRKAVWFQ
jgi:hypothetical protein